MNDRFDKVILDLYRFKFLLRTLEDATKEAMIHVQNGDISNAAKLLTHFEEDAESVLEMLESILVTLNPEGP